MKIKTTSIALALGLGLTLALIWLVSVLGFVGELPTVRAQGPDTRYVRSDGQDSGDCTNPTAPCRTVQYGVNQATPFDEILVATGTYTDSTGPVVTLTKTVTLRGGWNSDFSVQDPALHPAILDAQGVNRVVFVTGTLAAPITPTIEGFVVTGGNATGLGGSPGGDGGGGIYAHYASPMILNNVITNNVGTANNHAHGGGILLWHSPYTAVISGNLVISNVAGTAGSPYGASGGGLYISDSAVEIRGNTVQSNTSSTGYWAKGGGMSLWNNDNPDNHVTVISNTFQGNVATAGSLIGVGGGVYLEHSVATIRNNSVLSNFASSASPGTYGYGGGLYTLYENNAATIEGNLIQGNIGSTSGTGYGGGVFLRDSDKITVTGNMIRDNIGSTVGVGCGGIAVYQDDDPDGYGPKTTAHLDSNHVIGNVASISTTAEAYGGGIRVWSKQASNPVVVTATNNIVARNQANTSGDGMQLSGPNTMAFVVHNTIVGNRLGNAGEGVTLGGSAVATLINNIIVGHSVGITNTAPPTATISADHTLFYGNTTDYGSGVTSTNEVHGEPAFAGPNSGDHHIGSGSAAIDAGADARVTTDVDGDSRPIGSAPDIGADEAWLWVYLPLVLRAHGP